MKKLYMAILNWFISITPISWLFPDTSGERTVISMPTTENEKDVLDKKAFFDLLLAYRYANRHNKAYVKRCAKKIKRYIRKHRKGIRKLRTLSA